MVQATRIATFAAIALVSLVAAQDPPTDAIDVGTPGDVSAPQDPSVQPPADGGLDNIDDVTAPTDLETIDETSSVGDDLVETTDGTDDILATPTDGANSTATDTDSLVTPTDIDDDDLTSDNSTTTATDEDETSTTTIATRTRTTQDSTDEPTQASDNSGATNIFAPSAALVVPLILITFFA